MNLQGRNLLKETDLSAAEFLCLVDLGERLRLQKRMGMHASRLAEKHAPFVPGSFPSLRAGVGAARNEDVSGLSD